MIHKLLALTMLLLTCPGIRCQTQGQAARQLQQKISQVHYAPRICDDQLSETLWEAYLDELDPLRVCFLQEDITALEAYKLELDDALRAGEDRFLQEVLHRYQRGLRRCDSMVKALCALPLDFQQPDHYLDADAPATAWPADLAAQSSRWRCIVKERVLSLIFSRHVDSTGYQPAQLARLMAHEATLRERVQRRSALRITKRMEEAQEHVGNTFLKCLALQFDPHTEYFDLGAQQDFMAQLSTQKEGFGLSLQENAGGEVEIDRITPGGPAWKSGRVNAGDVLLSYAPDGGEPVDVQLSSAAEISAKMAESATDSMAFTVRKKDGQVLTVGLRKTILRADENLVKSFVIEGQHKVGYIQLPGFYEDWDQEGGGGRGCAGDVAKELIKLQKEGIEALVLDLRFNGGGSLREATDLAGIFIDGGPLWVARNRENARFTIKDPNRGAAYTGPMLVMVNSASASASEFLSTALQDHGRALIVGSTTFGKATSQSFFPLDPTAVEPKDCAKITSHKYYRLTGKSHQFVGVEPDIPLPDPWSRFVEGEGAMPWALQPDTVVKKVYYTPAQQPRLGALKSNSAARCAANADFKRMDQLSAQYKGLLEAKQQLTLDGQAWFAWEEKARSLLAELEKFKDHHPEGGYSVRVSQWDAAVLKVDEFTRSLREEQMQDLKKDLQLAECMHIIEDYLNP